MTAPTRVLHRPLMATDHRAGIRRVVALELACLALAGIGLGAIAATSDLGAGGRLAAVALAILLPLGAAVGVSRAGRVARGILALVVGIVALSAGLGVAPVWYATTGPTPVALAAALAAVGGLALAIIGALQLVRATPGWWRLLAIPVTLALLQFVVMPLAAATYGTHPPRTPLSGVRPSWAAEVSFATSDGVTQVAWYGASTNGAVVVLRPGSGGEKGSLVAHASALHDAGYGVLAMDARGTAESGGVGNAWGWHGERDIRAGVDWLLTQPRVERVAVLGLSMGAEEAITAAAGDPRITAVVAEGASARQPEDLAYMAGDPRSTVERTVSTAMWLIADLMTDATPPPPLVRLVSHLGARLMLVVGADADESMAAPLLQAAAPAMETWHLPDTPHMGALARHPDAWRERVIGFLDDRLGVVR